MPELLFEESLKSVSNHCGCRPSGPKGGKRLGTMYEIQKCVFPGRPSTQNWVEFRNMKK